MAKVSIDATSEVLNYIDELPVFSKAICTRLREIIMAAVPEIKEEWRWGPNYAHHGMVCGFSAFQKHAKLTFFNGSAMSDRMGLFNHCVDNEFSRSIKYTDLSQIDDEYIKESAAINEEGFKREIKDKTVAVPDEMLVALKREKKAADFFDKLSYGYKKEYVEWVYSAKQEKTRLDRLAKTIAKCAAGERLNDKYKK
jgi:hypothetical protein